MLTDSPLVPSAPCLPVARLFLVRFATLPGALALLLGLLLGVRLVPGVGVFDGHRLIELALLVGLGVGAVGQGRGGETWRALPRGARWMLGTVVVLGALSSARAPMPVYGFLEVSHLVLLVVAACVVADALRHEEQAVEKLLVPLYAGVALVMLGVTVAYAMHLAGTGTPLFPEAGLVFSNVRFFNQVQTWTLPLLPLLVPRALLPRRAVQGLFACWWMLLFASGGRASMLGTLSGIVVVLVIFRGRAWPWLRAQLRGLLLGSVGYGVFFYWLAQGMEGIVTRLGYGGSGRLRVWRLALDYVREAPLLGIGPMHFGYRPSIVYGAHPHNTPLQWASEWGLPAAGLLCGVALWAAWAGARRARATVRADDQVPVALVATWVGVAVVSLFDGVLVMPVSQLFAVLVGGWSLARCFPASASRTEGAAPAARSTSAWRAGVALATLVLIAAALPGVVRTPLRNAAYQQCALQRGTYEFRLIPRFWQVGILGDWTRTCTP